MKAFNRRQEHESYTISLQDFTENNPSTQKLIEKSDIIFLYFSPETKSPISLLELGLFAASEPEKMIVCCPDGFWRKGNVEITCTRFRVPFFDDIENAKGALRSFITSKKLI